MDIANNLLVEMEIDSAGLPNIINNPNGELGAWEWLTPVANTSMSTTYVDVDNYLTGSDFESTSPWTYSNGAGVSTLQKHSGTQSLRIPFNAAAGITPRASYPSIPTAQGNTYYVSYWVYRDANWNGTTANSRLKISNQAGAVITSVDFAASTIAASTWVQRTATFTVGAGVTALNIAITADATAGYVWIDDMQLTRTNNGDDPALKFVTTTSQAAYFTTESHAVIAGKYYSARLDSFDATASHTYRLSLQWLDSAGALLSTTTQGAASTPGTLTAPVTTFYGAYQAPSGAAFVRLRVDFYNGTGTTNPAANAYLTFRHAMITYTNTATAVTTTTNLMTNPSGETDATGWLAGSGTTSVVADSAVPALVGTKVIHASMWTNTDHVVSGAVYTGYANGPKIPGITGGLPYGIQVSMRWSNSGGNATAGGMLCRWFDASSNQIGGDVLLAEQAITTTGWTRISGVLTAPTGAAQFAMYPYAKYTQTDAAGGIEMYLDCAMVQQSSVISPYFDGSIVPYPYATVAWNGTANLSSSTAQTAPSAFAYNEGVSYQDITGSSATIGIIREELALGQATVLIFDPALDPAQVSSVNPGRKVRVSMKDSTGKVQRLFTGSLAEAKTSYDARGVLLPEVTLSLSDAVKDLANQTENRIVGTITDIPLVMEGKGVPWNVNGNTGQIATGTVVANNSGASVVDSLAVTRDTNRAFAWVDRFGIFNAYNTVPAGTAVHFTDNPAQLSNAHTYGYSALDPSYSTADVINTVTVNHLRFNPVTGQTDQIPYGPFVDSASVQKYGPVAKDFNVVLSTDSASAAQTFANAILTANANPTVKVNTITVPVKSLAQVADMAQIDLYSVVYLTNTNKFADVAHRVTSINHEITPEGWFITYSFQATGSVVAPTQLSSVGGVTAGNGMAGLVQMFAGTTPPAGWLVCDGRAVSRSANAALFNVIGTVYGAGDGSTTFNLPNLSGRVVVGVGTASANGATNHPLGQVNGEETHILTQTEMPIHSHSQGGHTFTWGQSGLFNSVYISNGLATAGNPPSNNLVTSQGSAGWASTNGAGGGAAHSIMQPYVAMNYIISTG